jgi:serine/threonine protein kinase
LKKKFLCELPYERGYKEYTTLAKLKHKNVIKLLQYYEIDEHERGRKRKSPTCADKPSKVILEYNLCLASLEHHWHPDYAKQLIHGLIYLHNNNIIHCLLQAKNILLAEKSKKYIVQITNFSEAREKNQYSGSVPGAVYEPPELTWDCSRDVFALGCLLRDVGQIYIPELLAQAPQQRLGYTSPSNYNLSLILDRLKSLSTTSHTGPTFDDYYTKEIEYTLPSALKKKMI